jgi:hypothetical protein
MTHTGAATATSDTSASHSARLTIFRTRRSASVDDASLLKY